MIKTNKIKFIYSEKAVNFEKISQFLLTLVGMPIQYKFGDTCVDFSMTYHGSGEAVITITNCSEVWATEKNVKKIIRQ